MENTEDGKISLENALQILTETSKLCLKIKAKKTYKHIKKSSNKKWCDCECRLKRHELKHYDERQHFVTFKISNHKLLIEQGRYQIVHLQENIDYVPYVTQIR